MSGVYAVPGSKKLPIGDKRHLSDAIEALSAGGFRGNRVQLSDSERRQAISAIRGRLREMDMSDEERTTMEARLAKLKTVNSFSITKQRNGVYRWWGITSVNATDRDGELITAKALEKDVNRTEMLGDDSLFLFNHIKVRLGGAPDIRMVVDGCLVESGEIDPTPVAQQIIKGVLDHPDAFDGEGWGLSIGFIGVPDGEGTYHTIRTKERSLLRLSRAANPFTSFQVEDQVKLTAIQKAALKDLEQLIGDDEMFAGAVKAVISAQEKSASIPDEVQRKAKKTDDDTEDKESDSGGDSYEEKKPAMKKAAKKKPADDEGDDESTESPDDESSEDAKPGKKKPMKKSAKLSDEELIAIKTFTEEVGATVLKTVTDILKPMIEIQNDLVERLETIEDEGNTIKARYEEPEHSNATYLRLKALSVGDKRDGNVDEADPLNEGPKNTKVKAGGSIWDTIPGLGGEEE